MPEGVRGHVDQPPRPLLTPSTSAATRASRDRCQVRRSSSTSRAGGGLEPGRQVDGLADDQGVAASSTITSPVATPMRTSIAGPPASSRSATASCMAAAALTARRASSSRTTGTPKVATTASPMNFCTSPWWRSSTALVRSK